MRIASIGMAEKERIAVREKQLLTVRRPRAPTAYHIEQATRRPSEQRQQPSPEFPFSLNSCEYEKLAVIRRNGSRINISKRRRQHRCLTPGSGALHEKLVRHPPFGEIKPRTVGEHLELRETVVSNLSCAQNSERRNRPGEPCNDYNHSK